MPQTCLCERCGRKCRTADAPSPPSKLIRKSTVPRGCCVDCAITCFIKTGPLADVMGGVHSAPGFNLADVLRMPHMQTQFAAVFRAAGCADVATEIDWERVIANWDLPAPIKGFDWQGQLYASR